MPLVAKSRVTTSSRFEEGEGIRGAGLGGKLIGEYSRGTVVTKCRQGHARVESLLLQQLQLHIPTQKDHIRLAGESQAARIPE
jgi:hypothetical protein